MNKIYYKILIVLSLLSPYIACNAQNTEIDTDHPGQVKEKLGNKADNTKSISIEGLINYSDIDFLRTLSTSKNLESINLLEAVISSGTSYNFPSFSTWPIKESVYKGIGTTTIDQIEALEKSLKSNRDQDIEAIYEGILSYYNSTIRFYQTTDPQNPYRYYLFDLENKTVKLVAYLFRPLTYAIYPIADSNKWGLNKGFKKLAEENKWMAQESAGDVFVFEQDNLPIQLEVTAWRHSDQKTYAQMKFLPKETETIYDIQSPDLEAFGLENPSEHIKAFEQNLNHDIETYAETSSLGESYVIRFNDGTQLTRKYQLEKGDYRLLSIVQEFAKEKQDVLQANNKSFKAFLKANEFEPIENENNVYINKKKEIKLTIKFADNPEDAFATMTFISTHKALSGYTMPLLNFDASVKDIFVYESHRGSKHEDNSSIGTYVFSFDSKSEFSRAVYEFSNDKLSVIRQFATSKDNIATTQFAEMIQNAGFVKSSSDQFSTIYLNKTNQIRLEVFNNDGLMEFKKYQEEPQPGTGGKQIFKKDENGYFLPLLCFNIEDPMPKIKEYEESANHKVSDLMPNMFTIDKAEYPRPFVDITYVLNSENNMLDIIRVGCSADNFSKRKFEEFILANGFEKIDGADGFDVEQRYYNKTLKILAEINIELGKTIVFSYNEQPN